MEEELEPRPPHETDLVSLCAALNAQDARYIVVGGMAVLYHGFMRATEDIDLLLETSRDNQNRIRQALEVLPDKAIREMADGDLDEYGVVRVGDEITVDLMMSACGITYEQAKGEIEYAVINGVSIPFASARLLLRMKQTYREKDIPDRIFLQEKLLRESEKQ